MTKAELRKLFLEKRSEISAEEHKKLSRQITERLFDEFDPAGFKAVSCFVSLRHKGEIETAEIFQRFWRGFPEIETHAPRINQKTGELESVTINADTTLTENKWKIPEPEGEVRDPQALDLVIVPLLCFDESGHRVGYGRGYYDRFLGSCRPDCLKAGISFFPPIKKIGNVHEPDIRLDLCVTPAESFRF